MLGNNHRSRDGETSTVQLNNTCTSLLGQYLLEGEWNFLLDHLSTSDGRRDVHEGSDPLGLFRGRGGSNGIGGVPSNDVTNSAFYAAIHVRAPFSVAKAIYEWERQKPNDAVVLTRSAEFLMCVLAVIPSEEEERLKHRRGGKNANQGMGRMQTWSLEDMDGILEMILRDDDAASAEVSYLARSPKWIIPSSAPTALPTLGIAAYNPDVSAGILRRIYEKEPRAAKEECTLFGRTTLPWIVAAASPLPPKHTNTNENGNNADMAPIISTRYQEQSDNRWEKVRFLLTQWDGSDATHAKNYFSLASTSASISTVPTMEQILSACEEAIRRGEWELVREFLKRYYYHSGGYLDLNEGNGKATTVPKAEAVRATSATATNTTERGEDDIPVVMAQPLTREEEISISFSSKLPEPSAPSLSSLTLQPTSASVATTTTTADQATILEPIHRLLVQHDQKVQAYYQRNYQKHHSNEEWMRKNMGLVMYQVDAMVDLASAVVPSSWMKKVKKRHSGSGGKDVEEELERGLVGPMS